MTYKMEATKNVDNNIAYARTEARRSGATILICRQGRPFIEVSPQGDVSEVPPPPLRVSLRERLADQILSRDAKASADGADFARIFLGLNVTPIIEDLMRPFAERMAA